MTNPFDKPTVIPEIVDTIKPADSAIKVSTLIDSGKSSLINHVFSDGEIYYNDLGFPIDYFGANLYRGSITGFGIFGTNVGYKMRCASIKIYGEVGSFTGYLAKASTIRVFPPKGEQHEE